MDNRHSGVRMVCTRCGSTHVAVEALAHWHVGHQQWVMVEHDDVDGFCYDCDDECVIGEEQSIAVLDRQRERLACN